MRYTLKELEEFVKKQEPKTSWGNWKLDKKHKSLDFVKDGDYQYEIRLEECLTAKDTWNWVLHLDSKTWTTKDDIANLVKALGYLVGYKGYWRNK